ncbi:MAG: hypothetical protein J6M02_01695 [Clostridia bacterium]|nr:hypothetical protein [Clostridia bacterium]
MDKNRQELYERFLEAYNSCAERLVGSLSEMILLVKDPWKAEKGKEEKMKALKEVWGDLDLVELAYTDDVSYQKGLNAIRRKLLVI